MDDGSTEPQGIGELLIRARSGDRGAEDALFERLHARILALAKKRIWDEETAKDIVQETMRTVFAKYRESEMPRGLLPWVFMILHNKVGNYLKRRRVELSHFESGDSTKLWETIGVNPCGEIGEIDLLASIERALEKASPDCRKIFRLLLAGATRHETRMAFGGKAMGTIDSRISRCRKKLLQHLGDVSRGGRKR